MIAPHRLLSLSAALLLASSVAAVAQTAPASSKPASAAVTKDDPDLDPNPAQPDFALVTLPTNLRLPQHKMAFRLTHRFGRPLDQGDFGDFLADGFGFDSGAQIGFEFRYGLVKGGQIGFYRTSNRTIEFFGQYELRSQEKFPVGVSVVANAEGTNNFKDSRSPSVGAVISREVGGRAALYIQPTWVNNTNPKPKALVNDNDTVMVGLGGRVNVHGHTYFVLEATPRVSGFKDGRTHIGFGIEQQAGGHVFQLNFSNGVGTTPAQVARGDAAGWYMGFNLSRKFY